MRTSSTIWRRKAGCYGDLDFGMVDTSSPRVRRPRNRVNSRSSRSLPASLPAHLLYLGDTARKNLLVDETGPAELGIPFIGHDKLPDKVLRDTGRNWLFLVEAVTSHGPMTPKRVVELKEMLSACPAAAVYVSAFTDFGEFRKHMKAIAWETEVWLCDAPEHTIHYEGDWFLGPRV